MIRIEAHKKGIKHKAISVFVICGSEILLQRRAMAKYHTPGLWTNTCCTHPFWEEDSLSCALRRLDDELGIVGLNLEYCHQLEYCAGVGNGLIENEVVDIFVAYADNTFDVCANPNEVMDVRWIGYKELLSDIYEYPECFTPWLKIY